MHNMYHKGLIQTELLKPNTYRLTYVRDIQVHVLYMLKTHCWYTVPYMPRRQRRRYRL